jgi:uncharacterized membrane protein HdeD (DUF308 family)
MKVIMNQRPLSVILISLLFIISGIAGIIYHFDELHELAEEPHEIGVLLVRILAIVGGIFILRKQSWARWLLVAWIAYHVYLSFYHSPVQVAVHIGFQILVLVALFNSRANQYFRG